MKQPSTAIARTAGSQQLTRYESNHLNPRLLVETDGGGVVRRQVSWVRFIVGPDLYNVRGNAKHDVWGSGVAKYVAAMGGHMTPMQHSIDPATGRRRPGTRIIEDESGVIVRIEADVLFTYYDQATGSPGFAVATGQVDVLHSLLGELFKLVESKREDEVRIVTKRVKDRMEDSSDFDAWVFLPWHIGSFMAINLASQRVREAQSKHREMARGDKVLGFAISKASRLALKQSNQVPMSFDRSQFKKLGGTEFIEYPVAAWLKFDSRVAAEAAAAAFMEEASDAGQLVFAVEDDEEGEPVGPETAAIAEELVTLFMDDDENDIGTPPPAREVVRLAAEPEPEDAEPEDAEPEAEPEAGAMSAGDILGLELRATKKDTAGVSVLRLTLKIPRNKPLDLSALDAGQIEGYVAGLRKMIGEVA